LPVRSVHLMGGPCDNMFSPFTLALGRASF
jgi:hypothetical protein